jgi:hypothetical protein
MVAPILRDPAGLVARCPELADLCERSPSLRKAIERGRPLDAYRALFFDAKRGRFREHAAVAASLLSRRRLFLKPITRVPVMATVNGVGARIYGESDRDLDDGTYVTTHFLVLLFVPVFPLAAYLVRPAVMNNGRQGWSFLARVPLGTATYLWQRAFALVLLFMIASGVAHAFTGYRNNTLYVVNGLARAVTVDVSGVPRKLIAANSEAPIETTTGAHRLVVRVDDRVIEDVAVTVPHAHVTAVWNILGLAPVVLAPVVYSGDNASTTPTEQPEILCGAESFERAGVDYPFTDPPKSLQASSNSQAPMLRWHLLVIPGEPNLCINRLFSKGDTGEAARLGVRVARALRAPAKELDGVTHSALLMLPPSEAEAFAKDLLSYDDSIEAHRVYQDILLTSHQRDRAVREYEDRLSAHPDSPDAAYLALRTKTLEEERAPVDALIVRYPTHPYLLRAHLWSHYSDRDFGPVAASADRLHEVDPRAWRDVLTQHVDALVALGRGSDARDRLHEVMGAHSLAVDERGSATILDFRVAHALAPKDELDIPASPSSDTSAWWPFSVRADTGLPLANVSTLKDEQMKTAALVISDARTDPDKALQLLKHASAGIVAFLPSSVATLLLAEATRTHDADAVRALGSPFGKALTDAIEAYVTSGTSDELLLSLSLEMRAALDLVRSRVTGLVASERDAALARAKTEDVLKGPVTVAMNGWTL